MPYELDRTTPVGALVKEYGDIRYKDGFIYGFITGIITTTLFLKIFISK